MLLYWGLFTVGFTVGAILSFLTFAAGKPEQEEIYDDYINQLSSELYNSAGNPKQAINPVVKNLDPGRTFWARDGADKLFTDNSNGNQGDKVTKVDNKGFAVN